MHAMAVVARLRPSLSWNYVRFRDCCKKDKEHQGRADNLHVRSILTYQKTTAFQAILPQDNHHTQSNLSSNIGRLIPPSSILAHILLSQQCKQSKKKAMIQNRPTNKRRSQ